jgi:hypothetical protein
VKIPYSKSCLLLVALVALGPLPASAADLEVQAVVALDADTQPATTFAADVPQLMAFFLSTGSQKGDTIHGVWIAEDVGDAAPPETEIDGATITCDKADCSGTFTLTKPTKGWPIGLYRVEISWNDELATTAEFEITEK